MKQRDLLAHSTRTGPSCFQGGSAASLVTPLFLISSFIGGRWQLNCSLRGDFQWTISVLFLCPYTLFHWNTGNNRHVQKRPIIKTLSFCDFLLSGFFFFFGSCFHFLVFVKGSLGSPLSDCHAVNYKIIF